MPSWSIRIVTINGVTSFDPPNLDAMQDDVVSWNNTTKEEHQPWQLQGKDGPPVVIEPLNRFAPTYMSDLIEPGDPSRPGYNVSVYPPLPVTTPPTPVPDSWTIYYHCKKHPQEKGTITGHAPGKGKTS